MLISYNRPISAS